jgi:hypothetical protein
MGCFFRNIDTGREAEVRGTTAYLYKIDATVKKGFNLHCEVSLEVGDIDLYKFLYDNKVVQQSGVSGWIDGVSQRGTNIAPSTFLGTCGDKKFKVQGFRSGTLCFEQEFSLTAQCDKAPTRAPTRAPTQAPIFTCQTGYKVLNGKCVLESCTGTFQCPCNSKPIAGRECISSMSDCQCDKGWMVAPGNKCVLDPNNCRDGYKMVNGRCSPTWCTSTYQCPANSKFRSDRECLSSIYDCECNSGYRIEGTQCVYNPCGDGKKMVGGSCQVEWCNSLYKCPPNSKPEDGKECVWGIYDCECDNKYAIVGDKCVFTNNPCNNGYKMVDGACRPEWCTSNFKCAPNSQLAKGKECAWSIWDCECEKGYRLNDQQDGCELNPCGPDMKLRDGRCIPSWCDHTKYVCPANSKIKVGKEKDCLSSIWDCTCIAGYRQNDENTGCELNPCGDKMKLRNGRCQPDWCQSNWTCPKRSKIAADKEKSCISNIWDCTCDSGYKIMGDRCVPSSCNSNFQSCPANSKIKDDKECLVGISDCICDDGYKVDGNRCIACGAGKKILNGMCVAESCMGTFQCPANSKPKQGNGDCVASMNDCVCNDNYKVSSNTCVYDANWCPSGKKMINGHCCVESCSSSYKCPGNSKINTIKDCIATIADCICDTGYMVSGGACVADPCAASGLKTIDGRCVPRWCSSDQYRCPLNSKIAAGKEKDCVQSIWDCTCNANYTMSGDQCVFNPCGVGKKLMSGRCVADWCTSTYTCPPNSKITPGKENDCIDNIWHCTCDSNHTMSDNQCVYNPCGVDKKLMGGRCVPSWCSSTFSCPPNSKITPGKENDCIENIWHCTCNANYTMSKDQCVFNPCGAGKKLMDGRCVQDWCDSRYMCGANSKITAGKENDCLYSIWDCTCSAGYKIEGDKCVPDGIACPKGKKLMNGYCCAESCDSQYKCPANSKINTSRNCISGISDCVCDTGYKVSGDACVYDGSCGAGMKILDGRCVPEACSTVTSFRCPANSKIAAGKEKACLTGIGDCVCDSGYRAENNTCVVNPCGDGFKPMNGRCVVENCASSFVCPANSKIATGKEKACLSGIGDCVCDVGFRVENNACVANPCGAGMKPLGKRCIPEDCSVTSFQCPINSKIVPGKEKSCLSGIGDCVCDTGFRFDNNACVANPCGAGFKPMNGRCVEESCVSSFVCPGDSKVASGKERACLTGMADCVCNTGYRLENNACVVNPCGDGFKPMDSRCVEATCLTSFKCPANYKIASGKEKACLTGIGDCVCDTGFRMENNVCVANPCGDGMKTMGGRCVPESCSATSSFVCPANSKIVAGKEKACLNSIADCACNTGFRLENNACIPNPCGDGMKPFGDRCVPSWCSSSFVCPSKSKIAPGKEKTCITGIWDCVCESGFRLDTDVCAPNPCGDGMKMMSERCVPEGCSPSSFVCPTNSKNVAGKENACLTNILDCTCNTGYKLVGTSCLLEGPCGVGFKLLGTRCAPETCSATSFQCPANSKIVSGKERACLSGMSDCVCDAGYRAEGNTCVINPCGSGMKPIGDRCTPEGCPALFSCPQNSKPAKGKERDCLVSIADCTCNDGFRMIGSQCVAPGPCGWDMKAFDDRCIPEICSSMYRCPTNAKVAKGKERACITGIADCACNSGFRLENNVCVTNPCGDGMKPFGDRCIPEDCQSIYKCPSNAKVVPGKEKDCITRVWDCTCNPGYRMVGGVCVVNPCGEGKKMLEGRCVADWCTSTYTCSANSKPLPGKDCLYNKWDCICNVGYKMVGDACVFDLCGNGKKMLNNQCIPTACNATFTCPSNAKPQVGKECIIGIQDCACDPGYKMEGGRCVPSGEKTCGCNCGLKEVAGTCLPTWPITAEGKPAGFATSSISK